MSFIFENLTIYKKSLDFFDISVTILDGIKGHGTLKDQLQRAALSISLNIAEGTGRFTKAEKRSFYVIARGSIYECVACIQIFSRKKLINSEQYSVMYAALEELSKMMQSLINSLSIRS